MGDWWFSAQLWLNSLMAINGPPLSLVQITKLHKLQGNILCLILKQPFCQSQNQQKK